MVMNNNFFRCPLASHLEKKRIEELLEEAESSGIAALDAAGYVNCLLSCPLLKLDNSVNSIPLSPVIFSD